MSVIVACTMFMWLTSLAFNSTMITMTYEEAGLLKPDNSTGVDSVNFARCLCYNLCDKEIMVDISEGFFNVVIDPSMSNETEVREMFLRCFYLLNKNLLLLLEVTDGPYNNEQQLMRLLEATKKRKCYSS